MNNTLQIHSQIKDFNFLIQQLIKNLSSVYFQNEELEKEIFRVKRTKTKKDENQNLLEFHLDEIDHLNIKLSSNCSLIKTLISDFDIIKKECENFISLCEDDLKTIETQRNEIINKLGLNNNNNNNMFMKQIDIFQIEVQKKQNQMKLNKMIEEKDNEIKEIKDVALKSLKQKFPIPNSQNPKKQRLSSQKSMPLQSIQLNNKIQPNRNKINQNESKPINPIDKIKFLSELLTETEQQLIKTRLSKTFSHICYSSSFEQFHENPTKLFDSIFGKSNCLFLIEKTTGEKIGFYNTSLIQFQKDVFYDKSTSNSFHFLLYTKEDQRKISSLYKVIQCHTQMKLMKMSDNGMLWMGDFSQNMFEKSMKPLQIQNDLAMFCREMFWMMIRNENNTDLTEFEIKHISMIELI